MLLQPGQTHAAPVSPSFVHDTSVHAPVNQKNEWKKIKLNFIFIWNFVCSWLIMLPLCETE